jgi:hypothetical protein
MIFKINTGAEIKGRLVDSVGSNGIIVGRKRETREGRVACQKSIGWTRLFTFLDLTIHPG